MPAFHSTWLYPTTGARNTRETMSSVGQTTSPTGGPGTTTSPAGGRTTAPTSGYTEDPVHPTVAGPTSGLSFTPPVPAGAFGEQGSARNSPFLRGPLAQFEAAKKLVGDAIAPPGPFDGPLPSQQAARLDPGNSVFSGISDYADVFPVAPQNVRQVPQGEEARRKPMAAFEG